MGDLAAKGAGFYNLNLAKYSLNEKVERGRERALISRMLIERRIDLWLRIVTGKG